MNPNIEILPNGVAAVKGDTHHGKWVAAQGLVHDKWMAKHIQDIMKLKGVNFCVDGGANIGTLTKVMLDAGAKVVAFEPNPDAADCLAVNCPEATLVRSGLGAENSYRKLIRDANVGASYLERAENWNEVPNEDLIVITKLDTYFSALMTPSGAKLPQLIKLDVEGCELAALRGAKETLVRARPVIITEINQGALARQSADPADVFAFLAAYGYRWRIMQPDCKPGDPQYDILATPK